MWVLNIYDNKYENLSKYVMTHTHTHKQYKTTIPDNFWTIKMSSNIKTQQNSLNHKYRHK